MEDLYKRNIDEMIEDVERINKNGFDLNDFPECNEEKEIYIYGTSYYYLTTDYNIKSTLERIENRLDKIISEIKFQIRLEQLK
jgi:hypothetical protein